MYPKMKWVVPCQLLAFVFIQNAKGHYWFEWEFPLNSTPGFGRSVSEGPKALQCLEWRWVSVGCGQAGLLLAYPLKQFIPMTADCEDLIIFRSDEWVQLFCCLVWRMWEHGIPAKAAYLTPSLQWTLSPGNFLKGWVLTELWLND